MGRASRSKRERRQNSGEGDCYEAAYLLAKQLNDAGAPAIVCHGIVTGNAEPVIGKRFGHAWVEMGDVVFDNSNGRETATRRARYYQNGTIDPSEVRRYEWQDAMLWALRTRHYGPWE